MNIVVCIKQIIDPEIPSEQFRLDPSSKRQVRGGLSLVISAYDQNALEVALQLREKAGGKITALAVGEPAAQGALKSAMGMGVDAGVLVADPALDGSDSFGAAHVLAQAIRKIGTPDLVLSGCVSGDTGNKVIGALVAEELRLPYLSFVSRLETRDGKIVARRIVEDGYEMVESPLPSVASIISDDGNVPRYSKLKDIMVAARKTVPVWGLADIGADLGKVGAASCRLRLRDISLVQRDSHCELVDGETPAQKAEKLAARLRDLKVI